MRSRGFSTSSAERQESTAAQLRFSRSGIGFEQLHGTPRGPDRVGQLARVQTRLGPGPDRHSEQGTAGWDHFDRVQRSLSRPVQLSEATSGPNASLRRLGRSLELTVVLATRVVEASIQPRESLSEQLFGHIPSIEREIGQLPSESILAFTTRALERHAPTIDQPRQKFGRFIGQKLMRFLMMMALGSIDADQSNPQCAAALATVDRVSIENLDHDAGLGLLIRMCCGADPSQQEKR